MRSRTQRGNQKVFFVSTLATAEQVGTTQLFNLNRSNLNLIPPKVPVMARALLMFKLIEDGGNKAVAHRGISKGGHNQGSGGEAPSCQRLRGWESVAPSRQQIFAVFTQKKYSV